MAAMLVHRGISVKDAAKVAGFGTTVAYSALKGLFYNAEPDNPIQEAWVDSKLDRLESAITLLTDQRGGIPAACCTAEQYEELQAAIEAARLS